MAAVVRGLIASAKITEYLLNEAHPQGGSKARFFLSRGFAPDRPSALADELSTHLLSALTKKTVTEPPSGSEKRIIVDGPMTCPDGRATLVRAIWKLDEASGTAEFVTAYPGRSPRRG